MAQCSSVGKRFVARLLFWLTLSTRKFLNSLGGKQHFSELRVIIKKETENREFLCFSKFRDLQDGFVVWVARKCTRPWDVTKSIKFALLNEIFMLGWVIFYIIIICIYSSNSFTTSSAKVHCHYDLHIDNVVEDFIISSASRTSSFAWS